MGRVGILCAILFALVACKARRDSSDVLADGGITKGGGDTIVCEPDADVKAKGGVYFEGDYNLDYLVTFQAAKVGDEPKLDDAKSYLDRVQNVLSARVPKMGESFRSFVGLIRNDDPTQARVWIPSDLPMLHYADEELEQVPPANCMHKETTKSQPNTTTLILRRVADNHGQIVFYNYDKARLEALRTERPMQYAYLMVHEWLWDYTQSRWANRTLNRYLQTKPVDGMNAAQLVTLIRSFAINIADDGALIAAGPENVNQPKPASVPTAPNVGAPLQSSPPIAAQRQYCAAINDHDKCRQNTKRQCDWVWDGDYDDSNKGRCLLRLGLPCVEYNKNSSNCYENSDRCGWLAGEDKCYELSPSSCSYYKQFRYPEDACNKSTLNCTFDFGSQRCIPAK